MVIDASTPSARKPKRPMRLTVAEAEALMVKHGLVLAPVEHERMLQGLTADRQPSRDGPKQVQSFWSMYFAERKFKVGITHFAKWRDVIKLQLARFRVQLDFHEIAHNVTDEEVYTWLRALLPKQTWGRFEQSTTAAETPAAFFIQIEKVFEEDLTGLDLAVDKAEHKKSTSFRAQVEAFREMYYSHHIRRLLTGPTFLATFQKRLRRPIAPAHGLFDSRLRDRLAGHGLTTLSLEFELDGMKFIMDTADQLDKEEAQGAALAERERAVEELRAIQKPGNRTAETRVSAAELDNARLLAIMEQHGIDPDEPAPGRGSGRGGGRGRWGRGNGRGGGGRNGGRSGGRFFPDGMSQAGSDYGGVGESRGGRARGRGWRSNDNGPVSGEIVSASTTVASPHVAAISVASLLTGKPLTAAARPGTPRASVPVASPARVVAVQTRGQVASEPATVPLERMPVDLADPASAARSSAPALPSIPEESPPTTEPSLVPTTDSRTTTPGDADAQAADADPAARESAAGGGVARPSRKRKHGPKRRGRLRYDAGDACGEDDSTQLVSRRRAAEAVLHQQAPWKALPSKVVNTILRSSIVMSLADVIALLRNQPLADLLLELGKLVNESPDALRGSAAAQSARVVSLLRDMALADDTLDPCTAAAVRTMTTRAVQPNELDRSFAAAAATTSVYDATRTSPEEWICETASIRKLDVSLTGHKDAVPLQAVVDEGSEIDCITHSALLRAQEDFKRGHLAFNERPDIGPQRVLCLERPIKIKAFNGSSTHCHFVAYVHLRVGVAVYNRPLVVVHSAPADVVLGAPFRNKYCRIAPKWARSADHRTEMTRLYLGVPEGFAISAPFALRQATGLAPEQLLFTQQVNLVTEWRPWALRGKPISSADAAALLSKH